MKLFQTIMIVFCLGIFLIPKDNFYIQTTPKESCCKSDNKMDCCKNNHKDHPTKETHNNKEKKSSCSDDCCLTCVLCHTFIETPFSKSLPIELSYYKANKNLYFQYSDPHISDGLKEIWQPPKIG